jgi:hypothetical protein
MPKVILGKGTFTINLALHTSLPSQFLCFFALTLNLVLLETAFLHGTEFVMQVALQNTLLLTRPQLLFSTHHYILLLIGPMTNHLSLQLLLPSHEESVIAGFDLHERAGTIWREDSSRLRLNWMRFFRRTLPY